MRFKLDQLCKLPEKLYSICGIHKTPSLDCRMCQNTKIHNDAIDACASVEVEVDVKKITEILFANSDRDGVYVIPAAEAIGVALPEILGKVKR